jgi:hypothetical protein
MNKTILLVGGSNIDYIATANDKLIRHSSNIGELEVSFGGVMRNVVEKIAFFICRHKKLYVLC